MTVVYRSPRSLILLYASKLQSIAHTSRTRASGSHAYHVSRGDVFAGSRVKLNLICYRPRRVLRSYIISEVLSTNAV